MTVAGVQFSNVCLAGASNAPWLRRYNISSVQSNKNKWFRTVSTEEGLIY